MEQTPEQRNLARILMAAREVDIDDVRDLRPEVLNPAGRIKVLPASFWRSTTVEERAAFGHRTGIYLFPTVELVEYLRAAIGDRSAIEIGAGNGVPAHTLGIPATDSRQHELPKYRAIYKAVGQPPVRYGPNIVHLDAAAAIRKYKPDVVIGAWVTHRWDAARDWAGGNEVGVDEDDVLDNCAVYINIGNQHVHAAKTIWERPHEIIHPDWLFSRATNGSPDYLATWTRD